MARHCLSLLFYLKWEVIGLWEKNLSNFLDGETNKDAAICACANQLKFETLKAARHLILWTISLCCNPFPILALTSMNCFKHQDWQTNNVFGLASHCELGRGSRFYRQCFSPFNCLWKSLAWQQCQRKGEKLVPQNSKLLQDWRCGKQASYFDSPHDQKESQFKSKTSSQSCRSSRVDYFCNTNLRWIFGWWQCAWIYNQDGCHRTVAMLFFLVQESMESPVNAAAWQKVFAVVQELGKRDWPYLEDQTKAPQLLRFIAPELLSIRQLDISRRRLWWLPSSLRSCERWKPQPLFYRHECSAKFSSTSDSRAEVKSFAARIWDKEVSSLLLKEVQDLLAIENLRRNFKEEFFKNSTLI